MAAKTGHDNSFKQEEAEVRRSYRESLKRMEKQGNAEGARYFRALIGGWSRSEAQRIAKGENVPAT
jgi:hypothetical protein